MSQVRERMEAAIAALNRKDAAGVDAALEALYRPGVRFRDPFQELHDRDEVLAYNRRLLRKARRIHMELAEIHETDEVLVLVWTMRYAARVGPELAMDGVSVLRHDGAQVSSHRDYFDPVGDATAAVPGLGRAWRAVMRRLA